MKGAAWFLPALVAGLLAALPADASGAPAVPSAWTGGPQLTFNPPAAGLQVGQSLAVQLEIAAVDGLYAYQFAVAYDPERVGAVGTFVNTFFDTTSATFIPAGWNAACAGGVCRFAASRVSPGVAVSGAGPLGQISFTGLSAGMSALTYNSSVLSDVHGDLMAHETAAGSLNVENAPTAVTLLGLRARPSWPAGPGLLLVFLAPLGLALLRSVLERRFPG